MHPERNALFEAIDQELTSSRDDPDEVAVMRRAGDAAGWSMEVEGDRYIYDRDGDAVTIRVRDRQAEALTGQPARGIGLTRGSRRFVPLSELS